MYISRVAILFTILFSTSILFATEKDSITKKQFGVILAGGSQPNLKGVYFTGGLHYSKNKMFYSFQYNYFCFNYIQINNFSGFLEYRNSVSALVGYKIPFHKFSVFLQSGFSFGSGRFASKKSYNSLGFAISENSAYFKTGFWGPIINISAKYNVTDKIGIGLSLTSLLNYYFKYAPYTNYYGNHDYKLQRLGNFYGLQFCIDYRIKQSTFNKNTNVKTIN